MVDGSRLSEATFDQLVEFPGVSNQGAAIFTFEEVGKVTGSLLHTIGRVDWESFADSLF